MLGVKFGAEVVEAWVWKSPSGCGLIQKITKPIGKDGKLNKYYFAKYSRDEPDERLRERRAWRF
jgi:hypothetical protein